MSSSLSYIEPEIVAGMVMDEEDVCIIDVREEEEFEAGHISGALHYPSEQWQHPAYVNGIIERMAPSTGRVIVHCHYSQQRGPRCAMILHRALGASTTSGDESAPQM